MIFLINSVCVAGYISFLCAWSSAVVQKLLKSHQIATMLHRLTQSFITMNTQSHIHCTAAVNTHKSTCTAENSLQEMNHFLLFVNNYSANNCLTVYWNETIAQKPTGEVREAFRHGSRPHSDRKRRCFHSFEWSSADRTFGKTQWLPIRHSDRVNLLFISWTSF